MKLIIIINIVSVLASVLGPAQAVRAEAHDLTTRALLADFFPHSQHVGYRTVEITAALKARLTQRLGYAPAKVRYTVFVATTNDRVDGYAVIDDEMGQHQPITFATRLSTRGAVERVEILTYRETRGDEVRDPRFRNQFVGKTGGAPMRLNQDIDAVSGATVSSHSMAVGVRRAAVLVEEAITGVAPTLASNSSSSGRN